MAHSEPGGNGMAALHPAENPGDGAQILKTAALAAARWTRSDTSRIQLVDRSRLLEVFQHVRIVGDLLAIDAVRLLRHLLDSFLPAERMLGLLLSMHRQCFQTGGDH